MQISSRLTAFCSLLAFIAGNSRLGPLLAIEGLFAQIHNDLKTTPPWFEKASSINEWTGFRPESNLEPVDNPIMLRVDLNTLKKKATSS